MSSISSIDQTNPVFAGTNKRASAAEGVSFSDLLEKSQNVTPDPSKAAVKKTATDEFLKYQSMTIAEKIRASYLAAHKLTEEDLAALPPEEREKIEDAIREEIRKAIAGNDNAPKATDTAPS